MSEESLRVLKDAPASSKQWDRHRDITEQSSARTSCTASVFGLPRWYSTMNFVFSDNTIPGIGAAGPADGAGGIGPSIWVDNLSSEDQEQLLLQEVLYVLCGAEGSLITVQPVSPRGITFSIDRRVEQSLRDLTLQITQLASYFYTVTHYVENYCDFKHGKVNQALSAAIRDIIKEYFIMISQLESFHTKGELTLQKMWFFIHPTMQAFAVLNSLVTDIEENELIGGPVLSVLHEKATSMVADEALSLLCQSLAQKASDPYFSILESWIYKGMITDPFLEFLVIDNDKGDGKMEQSDDYWEKRYEIDESKSPCFLRKMMPEILKAGKYLNVIRECGKDISMVSASRLHYSIHERVYVTAIENAYTFASKTLLDLLLNEYDLMRRLQSVKHYLLMDQGDFIVQFLDLAEDELNKQIDDLNPVRLESLLELALRTSSSSADPYKDNVRVQLFPYGIADQLWNIMAIGTPLEQEKLDNNFSYCIPGVEGFSFSYDVQWPISLVLNTRAITCYQMIFRQLFFCKHVERQLCKVWIANKSGKNIVLDKDTTGKADIFSTCQKMLNFVQNLQYYMAFEVIEPAWHVFLSTMSKVTNVDQVLSCHFDLLNSILADSMLISRSSLSKMTALLSICLKFCDKILATSDLRSHQNLQTSTVSVKELASQFFGKLAEFLFEVSVMVQDPNQSSKVANIIYRVNFNGFYTEPLEKLTVSK
ncbi:unnamed protein product [Orchesella dallaii]|uniref:Gamma-tubulin complex component n=1 Tax=Orchesella dallaii TaxID=48710 RepID=A0ABP1Q636_9HEXA